ncbi:MAG: alpha-D-ribose 1-methylphosphonate 5-triphosphate diphosphatase [Lutimaribacter sp.]
MRYSLIDATVLAPTGPGPGAVHVSAGLICAQPAAQAARISLPGCTVLPGIIDAHGDGFERHMAPRRGAMRDLAQGLSATEAELAANGITTAMLAQFWSWEGGMRAPEFAQRLLGAHKTYASRGTDMRVQLRFETHLLDDYTAFAQCVQDYGVGQVVFNDHLPHAALAAGKRPPRLTGQALKSGRSPEAHLALLQALSAQSARVPAQLAQLAARLAAGGVILGSHDDASPQTRAQWRAMGVGLCEFPKTHAAAQAARHGGDGIVLGAPNVVRGGSHSGNVSAQDLAEAGLCDALASDYHYPAPRQAALQLAPQLGLAAAWALVSTGPARLLGLHDRGQIAPGLRADLVVLDARGDVCLTVAGGLPTYATGQGAAALLAARG